MTERRLHLVPSRPLAQSQERRSASRAFVVGMLFNVLSLLIGNPYVIAALTVLIAVAAAMIWRRRRLAWVALASTLAANPVNLSASIACNVLIALAFLLLNLRTVVRLPRWLLASVSLALVSVLGSVFTWSAGLSQESVATQGAAVANYVAGPLLIVPALYAGLGEWEQPDYLASRLLLWLVAPTILFLVFARSLGAAIVDSPSIVQSYELVAVYRLWNVDVTLTRTQVGIALAALASGAFALVVAGGRGRWRWLASASVITSGVLLLLTGSVGSTISMLLAMLAVLVVTAGRRRIAKVLAVGAVAGTLMLGAWRFLPQGVAEYVGSRYEERFSAGRGIGASDRTSIWKRAAVYATDNPSGVGWSLYVPSLGTFPHNEYLAYSIAFGLLCGAVYLFVVARVWWSRWRVAWSEGDPSRAAIGLAGLGVATTLLINSMSDHLTANRWYFNVVWSVVWFCYFAAGQPSKAGRGVQPRSHSR